CCHVLTCVCSILYFWFVCCGSDCVDCLFFFFSSRRRHTRLVSDWSSDVCSSDLRVASAMRWSERGCAGTPRAPAATPAQYRRLRSEERRVGKECRSRGAADH